MLPELWTLATLSFVLASGAVVILLAAAGAIIAGRLVGEALDKKEPQDPLDIPWRRGTSGKVRWIEDRFPRQQPIPGIIFGEEQATDRSMVEEELPF